MLSKIKDGLVWFFGGALSICILLILYLLKKSTEAKTIINNKIGKQKVKNGNGNNEANNKYTLRDDKPNGSLADIINPTPVKKKKKRFLNFLKKKKK